MPLGSGVLVVAAAKAMSLRAFCAVAGREVGDLDLVLEAGLAQQLDVLVAVQHDVDETGAAMLGHVQVEKVEQILVEARRRFHAHELRPLAEAARRDRAKATSRFALPVDPERRHACTVRLAARPMKPDATSTPLKPAEPPTVRPVAVSNTARSQSPPPAFSLADTMPLIGAATWRVTTPAAPEAASAAHSR